MGKETHGYSRLLVVLGKTYCLECRQPELVTRDRMPAVACDWLDWLDWYLVMILLTYPTQTPVLLSGPAYIVIGPRG